MSHFLQSIMRSVQSPVRSKIMKRPPPWPDQLNRHYMLPTSQTQDIAVNEYIRCCHILCYCHTKECCGHSSTSIAIFRCFLKNMAELLSQTIPCDLDREVVRCPGLLANVPVRDLLEDVHRSPHHRPKQILFMLVLHMFLLQQLLMPQEFLVLSVYFLETLGLYLIFGVKMFPKIQCYICSD